MKRAIILLLIFLTLLIITYILIPLENNGIIVILMFCVFLTVMFVLIPSIIRNIKKYKKRLKIEKLKKEGLKLSVDLRDCYFSEIRHEREDVGPSAEVFNYFFRGKPFYSELRNEIEERCIVYYETKINGKKYFFSSETIPANAETLSVLFAIKENTYIYLDKKNKHNYYFDLSFLKCNVSPRADAGL